MKMMAEYGGIAWCLPPPVKGDWRDVGDEDASLLVARLAETMDDYGGLPLSVEAIRVSQLDFYPGWMLCDVQVSAHPRTSPPGNRSVAEDQSVLPRHIQSYLFGPDGFTPLDGASRPVHQHRELHGVVIDTDERRKAYLRFFCFFVRGVDGPFEVYENADAFDASAIQPPDASDKLDEVVQPLRSRVIKGNDDDATIYDACLLYGHQLFRAQFVIDTEGVIEMLGDELVGENVNRLPQVNFVGAARFPAPRPSPGEPAA